VVVGVTVVREKLIRVNKNILLVARIFLLE
jgi:hypothetical protein